ncbi:general transcription factor II-I repeat domain-containing protein 2A-like [Tachysurus ichikawai]
MTAFAGVRQPDLEMELADIADKDIWVSKFNLLTAELEDVSRQKAILALNHKWSDIENLPKPDKLVFETWNAIPDTYTNMKKYAFGSSDPHTYACVKMKVTSYSPCADVQEQVSH